MYFGSNDGFLYALNPDGSLKWRFEIGDKTILSSPAIGNDGTVYMGNRCLYAIGP
jgi:outer membrane protein assembly factor BamB